MGHLNLIRPLGLAGIPTIITVLDKSDFALRSRYVNGFCKIPGLEPANHAGTVEQLLRAGAELERIFGSRLPFFYGNDDALALLHRYRRDLERYYLLLLNADDLARVLADKELFYQRCRACGLLAPRTVRLGALGADDLASFGYPVVLKPRLKAHWTAMKRDVFGTAGKALIIESAKELLGNPQIQWHRDKLVLSALVPGSDQQLYSFHGFADEDGKVLAWFTGRKLRTFPPATGESSFIELCKEPALAEVGHTMIERLGVRGPFKIDFKKSRDDGLYYALEINSRYNLWHYLGAVSGINLPALGYRYLLTRERVGLCTVGVHAELVPPNNLGGYRLGYRWLNFYLDYQTARTMRRRGELSYPRWLLSLLGRNLYSAFAWQDPAPFVSWVGDFIQKKACS